MDYDEMLKEAESSDHGQRIVKELEPALKDALSRTTAPALEIGNREGGSGAVIIYYLDLEGRNRRFVTVDINVAPERITRLAKNHEHFRAEQKDWVVQNKEIFGFMFLDAEHDRDPVVKDMETLAPYLAEGGIMVVDDTNDWKDIPDDFAGLKRTDYGMRDIDSGNPDHVCYWTKVQIPVQTNGA